MNKTTTNLATSTAQFNVDGKAELDARLNGTASTQYQHKTNWLNRTDGFLVLDKNINGALDNGEELFSNSSVAEPYRGTASLATWDANADGVINANDPLFGNLLVWRGNYYKKRSCLRPNLLGYRPKTYLKTGKNCAKTASIRAKKRTNLAIKRGYSPMDMCASSYEICSNFKLNFALKYKSTRVRTSCDI